MTEPTSNDVPQDQVVENKVDPSQIAGPGSDAVSERPEYQDQSVLASNDENAPAASQPADAAPVDEGRTVVNPTAPNLAGVPVDDSAEPADADAAHKATDAQVQGKQ